MSRRIDHRYILTGTLVTETALHVGGLATYAGADNALARDGRDQLYIPGTSLAGALRAVTRAVCADCDAVKALWGDKPDKTDTGAASLVIVENAIAQGDPIVELRDGVGIDRIHGRAADAIKYDREVLPRGSRFKVCVMSDLRASDTEAEAAFLALAHALKDKPFWLGAGQTRGLGRVRLEGAKLERRELRTRAGILAHLVDKSVPFADTAWPLVPDLAKPDPSAARETIEIKWQPIGPLMVAAAPTSGKNDIGPKHGSTEAGPRLVIPGSSIKGALRSHAERIMATVLGVDRSEKHDFLDQVDALELVKVLFGTANKKDDAQPKPGGLRLGRGALGVADCYATTKAINFPLITRVAIDRWTGGAADGALYVVEEPWDVTWEPIRLDLTPARLGIASTERGVAAEIVAGAARVLLHLVLEDMHRGLIPLGFGTNRGLGALKFMDNVNPISITPEHRAAWTAYVAT